MSEVVNSYNWQKFKNDICIDAEHSLQYIRRQCVNENEIVLMMHITNQCLKSLHEFKQGSLGVTFIQILNIFWAENYAVLIKKD